MFQFGIRSLFFLFVCAIGSTASAQVFEPLVGPDTAGGDGTGVFWSVTTGDDAVITHLLYEPTVAQGQPVTLRIYTRDGTHVGFEDDRTAWTLHGEFDATSAGANTLVPLVPPIHVQRDQQRSVYVVSVVGGMNYNDGASWVTSPDEFDQRSEGASNSEFGPVNAFASSTIDFYYRYAKSGAQAGSRFGSACANVGDVDGDGTDDFAVGAPLYDDNSRDEAGRVYVYSGEQTESPFGKNRHRLIGTMTGRNQGDRFGSAICGTADVNGDGRGEIVVGAPYYDDGNESNVGRIYVFSFNGKTFERIRTKTGRRPGDRFGMSLATIGVVDGTGNPAIVVGAPYYNDGGDTDAGRIYVYEIGDNFSLLRTKTGREENDRFGWAVAGLNDITGDGFGDFIVGAPYYDDGGDDNAGRVYVYEGGNDYSLLRTKTGKNEGDQFGRAVVGLCGSPNPGPNDINIIHDSGAREWFAVGAPYFDEGNLDNAGKVWLYDTDASFTFIESATGMLESERFGFALARGGTYADPRNRALIGAIHHNTYGNKAGAGYYLDSSASLAPRFLMPSHSAGARSGVAMCAIPRGGILNRQLVCGYRDDAVGDEAGVAIIYDLFTNVEPDFPVGMSLMAPPVESPSLVPDFGLEEDILASASIDAAERARETADLDHDDIVNQADLMMLLEQYGPCDANCNADFNQDGLVDTFDLLALLSVWEN